VLVGEKLCLLFTGIFFLFAAPSILRGFQDDQTSRIDFLHPLQYSSFQEPFIGATIKVVRAIIATFYKSAIPVVTGFCLAYAHIRFCKQLGRSCLWQFIKNLLSAYLAGGFIRILYCRFQVCRKTPLNKREIVSPIAENWILIRLLASSILFNVSRSSGVTRYRGGYLSNSHHFNPHFTGIFIYMYSKRACLSQFHSDGF